MSFKAQFNKIKTENQTKKLKEFYMAQLLNELKLNLKDEIKNPIITNESTLRQISVIITRNEVRESGIFETLKECITRGWVSGVGLSAIQVGIPVRYGIYKLKDEFFELINPIITVKKEIIGHKNEGCLSIPNQRYQTWRYNYIEYTLSDSSKVKTAEGFKALVIQHEVDHMNGILCSDRINKPIVPGRNKPCSCGSNRKYKKCCGGFTVESQGLRYDV